MSLQFLVDFSTAQSSAGLDQQSNPSSVLPLHSGRWNAEYQASSEVAVSDAVPGATCNSGEALCRLFGTSPNAGFQHADFVKLLSDEVSVACVL